MIIFLLTRPMRGATLSIFSFSPDIKFLLTRPMRGATIKNRLFAKISKISTHTPHAGRDTDRNCHICALLRFLLTRPMRGATKVKIIHHRSNKFLLTRPMRGATKPFIYFCGFTIISTHTPHAGRDHSLWSMYWLSSYFYSHAPCGARL